MNRSDLPPHYQAQVDAQLAAQSKTVASAVAQVKREEKRKRHGAIRTPDRDGVMRDSRLEAEFLESLRLLFGPDKVFPQVSMEVAGGKRARPDYMIVAGECEVSSAEVLAIFGHPVKASVIVWADAKGHETERSKLARARLAERGVYINLLKRGGRK